MLRACGLLFSRSGTHDGNLLDNQCAASRRVWFYQIVSRWVTLEKQALLRTIIFTMLNYSSRSPLCCFGGLWNYCYFGRDRWVLHHRSSDVNVLSLSDPAKTLKYVKHHSNAVWATLHFKPKWLGSLFRNTSIEERLLESRLVFKWNTAVCLLKSFVVSFILLQWNSSLGFERLMKASCYYIHVSIFGCLQKKTRLI